MLVMIVAVVLAYKANTGCRSCPTYDLHVQIEGRLANCRRATTSTGRGPGRPRHQHHGDPRPRRHTDRRREPRAAQERRAAAGRHALHHAPEGLDRRQVSARSPPAARRAACTTGRPSRSARPAPRPIWTRCWPCSARRPAKACSSRRSGSARRSPGADCDINGRSASSCRWSPTCCRSRPTWRRRAPTWRVLPRSGAVLERAGPGRPDPGVAVHEPQHDVLGAGRSRAVTAGHDLKHAAGVRGRDQPVPIIRPFLTDTASLLTQFEPGIRRCGPARRYSPTCSAPARRTSRRRSRSTVGWCRSRRRSAGLANKPAVLEGVNSLSLHDQAAAAAARVPDAGPVDLQLRDAVPAQHRRVR